MRESARLSRGEQHPARSRSASERKQATKCDAASCNYLCSTAWLYFWRRASAGLPKQDSTEAACSKAELAAAGSNKDPRPEKSCLLLASRWENVQMSLILFLPSRLFPPKACYDAVLRVCGENRGPAPAPAAVDGRVDFPLRPAPREQ